MCYTGEDLLILLIMCYNAEAKQGQASFHVGGNRRLLWPSWLNSKNFWVPVRFRILSRIAILSYWSTGLLNWRMGSGWWGSRTSLAMSLSSRGIFRDTRWCRVSWSSKRWPRWGRLRCWSCLHMPENWPCLPASTTAGSGSRCTPATSCGSRLNSWRSGAV